VRPLLITSLLLGSSLLGCTKHARAPLVVERIQVSEESVASAPALGLGANGFRDAVRSALEQQGTIFLQAGQKPPAETTPFRLHAELESARLLDIPLGDGGVGLEAQVDLGLEATRTGSEETLKLLGAATGKAMAPPAPDHEGQSAAIHLAFTRAVDRAAAALVRGAQAVDTSSDVLRAQLSAPDAGMREAAADVLVDRHDASAIPVLEAELADDDDHIKLKAIGELVELRARSAVPRLIDLAQTSDPRLGTDPRFQMQIIYALGAIGGAESEAYLYTIASGHPDEMVRNAAREASTELARPRSAPKAPTP
jgi:hypothetical protein